MLEKEPCPPNSINKPHRLNLLPKNEEPSDETKACGSGRFPSWLHRSVQKGFNQDITGQILGENKLHTVCEEAKCPNLLECWSKKTATFLSMGKACTRSCGFCDIDFNKNPEKLEDDEPQRIADSVKKLGLKHVVITMVARDDLIDGGAQHMANIINEIRNTVENVTLEVLTSDFAGNRKSLDIVLQARPEIFNHNIETVKRLTPRVRHTATYERTLKVLSHANKNRLSPLTLIKSGLMLGLGETREEIQETLKDLYEAGCHIVTMGQYLQPNRKKLLVKDFIHPDEFKFFEDFGHSIGIKHMYCGPFVRSSYNAKDILTKINLVTLETQ